MRITKAIKTLRSNRNNVATKVSKLKASGYRNEEILRACFIVAGMTRG